MRIKTKIKIPDNKLGTRQCTLGLSKEDFVNNFGWDVEFFGDLHKSSRDKDVFVFLIDEVNRAGKCQSSRTLDIKDKRDIGIIKRIITSDYELPKELIDDIF